MSDCTQNPSKENKCTRHPIGDPRNVIDPLEGFCTLAGSGGDSVRAAACGAIGDNEWGNPIKGAEGSCYYSSCNDYQNFIETECCSGCCPEIGAQVTCSRIAYRGDPLTCCFNDYDSNQSNENLCFENSTQERTCDPEHRDLAKPSCQGITFEYCLGLREGDKSVDDEEWFKRWKDTDVYIQGERNCTYALKRNLFGDDWIHANFFNGNTEPIIPSLYDNREGVEWGQELMDSVFSKYTDQGYIIGAVPGQPGYNKFQNTLFTICQKSPGICRNSLNSICSNQTPEDLVQNPSLLPWCGCYLPPSHSHRSHSSVERECSPVCARQGNIPMASESLTSVQKCEERICILDQLNRELTESSSEQHNFNQVCGACSSSFNANGGIDDGSNEGNGCTCYIDDSTPITAEIQEACGTIMHLNSRDEKPHSDKKEKIASCRWNIWTIIVWGLIVVAVILFIIFLTQIGGNTKTRVITSRKTMSPKTISTYTTNTTTQVDPLLLQTWYVPPMAPSLTTTKTTPYSPSSSTQVPPQLPSRPSQETYVPEGTRVPRQWVSKPEGNLPDAIPENFYVTQNFSRDVVQPRSPPQSTSGQPSNVFPTQKYEKIQPFSTQLYR